MRALDTKHSLTQKPVFYFKVEVFSPVFLLPSLKESGHLKQIQMTVGIVGSRKLEDEDPGSQGWNIFSPHLTIYGFDADADACNKMNAELESRQVEWREKHIPLALWNAPGKATLHINKDPGSSSLYPPNESYIQRYMINSLHMELVSRVEVEVTCQSKLQSIEFS